VVRTPVAGFSLSHNHAEAVVRTPVTARSINHNHAEGVVGR